MYREIVTKTAVSELISEDISGVFSNIDHEDLALSIDDMGNWEYRNLDGKLHRRSGPAWISRDSKSKKFFLAGVLHREDGPAVVYENNGILGRVEEWWSLGQTHRVGGPAIVRESVAGVDLPCQEWMEYGLLHRTDGPAVIYADGREEFWVRGKRQDL